MPGIPFLVFAHLSVLAVIPRYQIWEAIIKVVVRYKFGMNIHNVLPVASPGLVSQAAHLSVLAVQPLLGYQNWKASTNG